MPTTLLKLKRRKDGYYYTNWFDDNEKQHKKTFGKKKREAENRFAKFHEQWKCDPSTRNPDGEGPVTINQAWRHYELHARAHYRDEDGQQSRGYDGMVNAFSIVLELYGNEPASDFTPAKLERCQGGMVAKGYCVQTVNRRSTQIRTVFRWLARHDIVPVEVWHKLQTVTAIKPGRGIPFNGEIYTPSKSKGVKAVNDQLVWQTCEHLPPSVAAMVTMHYYTGCRPQDVCNLRPIDIDQRGEVWVYRPRKHKTKHHGYEREVYIGPKAQTAIKPYLDRATKLDAYLFTPQLAHEERTQAQRQAYTPPEHAEGDYRNWPSYQRRLEEREAKRAAGLAKFNPYWKVRAYARCIEKTCQDHGLPHWSPNQLRHNAAERIRSDYGLDAAQVILGHSSAVVTEVYAEADKQKAAGVMSRVG
jgi:integrase